MKSYRRILIASSLAMVGLLSACSLIDEDACQVNYIEYRYLNNVNLESTYPYLAKVTDFIFTKDSVLYRVDSNITNGKIAKRPINLPDGEWIVYTYANLNGASKVSDYVIGKTRLSEMSVRVHNPPSYTGTYAPGNGETPTLRTGDSDRLYFGKVALSVKGGFTDRIYTVDMSNTHIWFSGTVRWKRPMDFFNRANENFHIRLEYVPVEFSFLNDNKMDSKYNIPYSTPRITEELATHFVKLEPTNKIGEYTFQVYGLRWEKGRAPVLRIYNGESSLINKELPLNKYFDEQDINLTYTRVQFFNLLIEVDEEIVSISDISIGGWENGGSIQ